MILLKGHFHIFFIFKFLKFFLRKLVKSYKIELFCNTNEGVFEALKFLK